jgi:ankyrin repeat protein
MKLTVEPGLIYRFALRKGTDSYTTAPIDLAVLTMSCRLGNREDCLARAQEEARRNIAITTLSLAAEKGYLDVVKQLLEKGAAIETRSEFGYTPLFIAAESGQFEVVKWLLEKGAAVDAKDTDGATPLWVAAYAGHLNVLTLLLDKGADPNANARGQTALRIAEGKGRTDMAEVLRKHGAK